MTAVRINVRGSALLGGILPHLMINVSVSQVWALSLVGAAVAVPVGVYLHRAAPGSGGRTRRPARSSSPSSVTASA